jgi:hypothetical protein
MSSLPPACPRLLLAFQTAATTVLGLILGIAPRRFSGKPVDRVLAALVTTAEECTPLFVVAYANGDDPKMRVKAALAIEALVLRAFSRDVATYLFAGGPPLPVTSIPNDLLPEEATVELLVHLVERVGKNPDDPHVLGQAALARWNLALAVLSEPDVWGFVRRIVGVLLSHSRITTDQLDQIIRESGDLAELLDAYAAEVADVLVGWHHGASSVTMEVAS